MLPPASDTAEISVADLVALLNGESAPMVVDCREQDEYDLCRLQDSVLIPLSTFAVAMEGKLPGKNSPIVVYCHHGMRSQRATAFLRAKGYTKAFSMVGGIDTWAVEVDPQMTRY